MASEKQVEKTSFARRLGQTLKGIAKLMLCSKKVSYRCVKHDVPLVVLGNGPSLGATIAEHIDKLREYDTMAVNFAANTAEFRLLKPKCYILADPHFFDNAGDKNVASLLASLQAVDWPMTLFVPFPAKKHNPLCPTEYLKIEGYNAVGAEGFDWFTRWAYSRRLAMPRPRNVLIPAIMTGIGMGYERIYLTGADHSWMRTVSVDENNGVYSALTHYYKDNDSEEKRVRKEYLKYPLHHVIYSFYVAFKAYFEIEAFARWRGVEILNSTPGSYIDAFRRAAL